MQNLLTNALPPLLATVLEPIWVLLTRISCVMKPMEELQKMSADARRSLLLKYNSLPPQLNTWYAIRARHSVIAVMTLVAVLANVLTIALAGLFIQKPVVQVQQSISTAICSPVTAGDLQYVSVGNNSFGGAQAQAYLVALSNFTGGTSLPPWTSAQYFFMPVKFKQAETIDGQEYILNTTGYGSDLTCQELTVDPSDNMVNITFNSTATQARIATQYIESDSFLVNCATGMNLGGIPNGRKGFELVGSISNPNPSIMTANKTRSESVCSRKITKGWARADLEMQPDPSNRTTSGPSGLQRVEISNLQTSIVSCEARLKSVPLKVTFSEVGAVLDSVPIGEPIYDDPKTNLSLILRETAELLAGGGPVGGIFWHNGTLAVDYVQEMIRDLTKSTNFVDPATPLPDFATISSTLKDLHSRLFAIQMSLRTSAFLSAPASSAPIPVQIASFETRTFMSESMYRLALAILCIDIVVAFVFFLQAPRPFLPRLPTTVASQLAFFGNSHAWADVQDAARNAPDGELLDLAKNKRKYGYGSYVSSDGRPHMGIERVPFVQPVARARKRKVVPSPKSEEG